MQLVYSKDVRLRPSMSWKLLPRALRPEAKRDHIHTKAFDVHMNLCSLLDLLVPFPALDTVRWEPGW